MPPGPIAHDPDHALNSPQLQAALEYAGQGFRVYPCRPGSKLPAGPWRDGATSDALSIIDLWLPRPTANVLVVCGPLSGLTVLDFDVKGGAPGESLASELLGDSWKTRHCYTTTPSGGYHLWCPWSAEWGNQKHVPGLDCQGEGSYVVVPPSVVDGRPYLRVNPHLPLVSVLGPEAHARVSARLGTRIRTVPGDAGAALPEGWQDTDCPEWREVFGLLSPRVRYFLETGDPDARPPGDETSRPFDTRSGAVMAVAVNLLALRGDNGRSRWLLEPLAVLKLLAQVGHVVQYAEDHAGGSERAPWWLWRYNVVPARDNVRRVAFDGVVSGEDASEDRPDPQVATGEPNGYGAPDDPLTAILGRIGAMVPPYNAGVREICHATARAALDELDQQRVIETLAERTEIGRPLLRRQLAAEVRLAVQERRDAEKRTPDGVLSQYVYVEQAGALWKLNPPGWVTLTAFRAMWGTDAATAALEPAGGVPRCSRATYAPGQQWGPGFDRQAARWVLDPDTQQWCLNTWEPSTLIPMAEATDADVAPWLYHVDEVLRVPAGDREHLLDWLACTVQFPGAKVNHMLLLGGGQGIGKDTLLEPAIRAVGAENSLVTTGAAAISGFDSEKLGHCALLVLQELSTGDLAEARRAYNCLKTYISAPPDKLEINVKGVKQFYVPNLVKVAAVTNDRRALRIEQDDRRAFMVWCEGRPADATPEYFRDLWRWYGTGGLEAVAGWLLQRDLSRFDPMSRPPVTSWRTQAQEDSLPEVAQVVRDLIVEGEGPAGQDVVTAADLLPMVRLRMVGARVPPTERSVGQALTELGYLSRRLNEPRDRAKMAGRLSRQKITFFIIRNEIRWRLETNEAFWAI